jgi:hypothetical protein
MASSLPRRDVLLAALAAAVAAGLPPGSWAAAPMDVDGFLALSERLTRSSGLDAGIAKTLLGGFLATGQGPGLAALAEGGTAAQGQAALADALVAAWYSGVYDSGHGQAVADFDGALLWTALSFTKPFAQYGGATGYWADPPQG